MPADSIHDSISPSLRPIDLPGVDIQRRWLKATVLTITVLLVAIGLVLAVRRFSGALVEQLPRGQMLQAALIATALAAYGRTAWQRAFFSDYSRLRLRRLDLLVGWGSSLGLLLLAIGCCYPADRLSDWLIWLPLLIADQFWRQSFFDGGKPSASPLQQTATDIGNCETASVESDEQVLQQLFRVRQTDGQEMIYGTLRADFALGQRTATLHVGFCPPLAHQPQVEAEPQEGPESTVKVTQALAHGARLDLRLAKPADEPCHVLIDLAAMP